MGTGDLYCWGDNDNGQLGDGATTDIRTPFLVPGVAMATEIAAGQNHTCALISGGTLMCWGDNAYGQLGSGNTTDIRVPTPVPGISGALTLASGNNYVCVTETGGTVTCMGYALEGGLGTGIGVNAQSTPTQIPGFTGVSRAAGGNASAYFLMSDGTARGVGYVGPGSIGTGDTLRYPFPTVAPF